MFFVYNSKLKLYSYSEHVYTFELSLDILIHINSPTHPL